MFRNRAFPVRLMNAESASSANATIRVPLLGPPSLASSAWAEAGSPPFPAMLAHPYSVPVGSFTSVLEPVGIDGAYAQLGGAQRKMDPDIRTSTPSPSGTKGLWFS